MADNQENEPRFTIPLPGGRVARVPLAVLEQHVDGKAKASHAAPKTPGSPAHGFMGGSGPGGSAAGLAPTTGGAPGTTTTIQAGDGMITINIYAGRGEASIARSDEAAPIDDDVVAHSMSVDATTGMSEWHTDWEFGECDYTDESGFPQKVQAWHRHPFGTEYTELYEG